VSFLLPFSLPDSDGLDAVMRVREAVQEPCRSGGM
jgi:hypothetical protein